ncbi:MAG: hypothetical protein ACKUBY_00080 [Candidatus Moraniibacteriota bacterium]|jgi:hypothetical protein
MKTYKVENMGQLLDIMGAGCIDPSDAGPVVVSVTIWDGRVIEGAYGEKPGGGNSLIGDVETDHYIFIDVEPIRPFAEKLLDEGNQSFFTVCGEDDMVCSLEWRIPNPISTT